MDTFSESSAGAAILIKLSDVIIVGGGMVGLLTAVALLQSTNLTVTLLDEKCIKPDVEKAGYSARVSAITLASKLFLSRLGVFSEIQKRRVSPFKAIHVWDAVSDAALHFESRDIGKELLGFIIENEVISAALDDVLSHYPAFSVQRGRPVQALSQQDKSVLVTTDDGEQWLANLVIGADGAHSLVRKAAGIAVQCDPYDVTAIVATVNTEASHNEIARQVFLEAGPLAFLPLESEHYSSIVWSLPAQLAEQHMALVEDEFNAVLTKAFLNRLGKVRLVDKRYAFPLVKQQAISYIAERIVLVGDAAHVVHPLAGQGINLGIGDVAILRDVIVEALEKKRDFSSHSVLRRYERAAKTNVFMMIKAIDVIHHLFVEQNACYTVVRQSGMKILEACGFLKQCVIRAATDA